MRDYYLSKIANFKELRNHCNVILIAIMVALSGLFIEHSINLKLIIIAISFFICGIFAFLRYNHYNRLVKKYIERLK